MFLTERPAQTSLPSAVAVLNRSDSSLCPVVLDPRRRVGQALTTEAIAKCIRSGGVWEAESNVEWLDLVSSPAAPDWDVSFRVERINF